MPPYTGCLSFRILLPVLFCGAIHPPALQGAAATAAAKRSSTYGSLREAFRQARLQATPHGKGFQAENFHHQLEIDFAPAGLKISHPEGRMEVRLVAYGRRDNLIPPASASVRASGNLIQYHRGPLTEWYLNDERGLEQGFILKERPAGPLDAPLAFDLEVIGDLQPSCAGEALSLTRNGRPVMQYHDLRAWDANGRPLSVRMDLTGSRIRLSVDDEDAVYPVTVDPWLQQVGMAPSDPAAGDQFGNSVALSGDTAIVGASGKANSQGAAYIFVRRGTVWTQQQKLTAFDGLANDLFGFAVSVSGDSALVGAPGNSSNQGAAYVFVRIGNTWFPQQKLVANDSQAGDSFGFSVFVHADTTIAGAPNQAGSKGAAYLFTRSATVWTQQQKLTATDGLPGDSLGWSVALHQNTAVAGAPNQAGSQGAGYVFVLNGAVWSQQQKLTAFDGTAGDHFGFSVTVWGDTAGAGAPGKATSQGAIYLFGRVGASWSFEQKLTASDGQPNDAFGCSVSVGDGTLIVGAASSATYRGAAYPYIRSGSTWVGEQKLLAPSGQANEYYGHSVALDGDTAVVGAYLTDGQGAAFGYFFEGSRWNGQAVLAAPSGSAADHFGFGVAVDTDTAVVGAYNEGFFLGAAYVFVRTGTTWRLQQRLSATDGALYFGLSVSINGDTILVGAPASHNYDGAVYVFVRMGTGWGLQQKLVPAGSSYLFGLSTSISGDTAIVGTNARDALVYLRSGTTWNLQQSLPKPTLITQEFGISVCIDSNTAIVGEPSAGAAYVYVRTGTSWTLQQKLAPSDIAGNRFGQSLSLSADTALIGALSQANGQGSAYIFVRTAGTWQQQQKLTAIDGAAGDQFGYNLSLAGTTAVIGAPNQAANKGAAYVFVPREGTWTLFQKITASNGSADDRFGEVVSVSGNTILIGASGTSGYKGSAYIFQLTHLLRTASSPAPGGSVLPPSGTYFDPGTVVPLQATANPGYAFGSWAGPVANPANPSTTVTMNGPVVATANFGSPVSVTVNTNPTGASFTVDSIAYNTPQTLSWAAGSSHQVSVTTTQSAGTGSQYVWLNWSDNQPATHTVSPTTNTTYTANFKTQYQLTMNAGAGGTVSPTSAFFDAASSVNISATPNSGFSFSAWTGSGSGSYTGPNASSSVTMNAPITESATFNSTAAFTARLNAGGAAYNDPLGNLWSPDSTIPNTLTFLTQNPIRNTSKPYLYQSERFSLAAPFQYTLSSVPNGTYNIRLMFAETYFTQPNQRKFNVNINGNSALSNFDIAAAAGGSNTAIDTLHSVTVTNNQIAIQFTPVLSNPKISAIEITPQTTAIALAPSLSDPLAPAATQQFTPTVIGNANNNVTYSLSPNIGNITPAGLYTAPTVANPTKVILTAASQADPSKSATALIQLVPQPWSSQDIGLPNLPGSSTFSANAFNLQGAGDLLPASDSFRFTFNKLTGDGAIVARVNQPFTGQTSNKSGVMMRGDFTPGSLYADTNLYSSIVGLFHWRTTPSGPTNAQFGAAGVPWVRLARTGNTISSYVSNDATAWIPIGSPQTLSAPGIFAGLTASNGFSATANTVTFDNIDLSTSPVAVSINEGLSSLAPNQQAQFTANVIGAANTAVTWSISPTGQGSIDANTGLYIAPATINPSPQTVTITATSVADPTRSASIIVYLGTFQIIRVNCGGPSHYDPTGTFWFGDTGAVAGQGNVFSAGNSIANTLTPYLYQSERFIANATLTYKYFVPNGTYNVTLKFAEIYFTTPNQRVMNVSINGATVLSNFDIVAQSAPNTATDRSFPVTVSNGAITIALSPAIAGHAPKINAIQIQ